MAESDNLDYSKRSVNELLEQLSADSQYNGRSYPNMEMPRDYATEPAYMQRGNMYFPEQYPSAESRNTLPFMFNTREDVMPTMVGMGGGNFMVYGTPAQERNMNVPNNMNFANKTNGSLSGLSDYSNEYNLFSGGISSVGSSFKSPSPDTSTGATPHLIDNLVGHWGSDQSGTYSPFGSCARGVQTLCDIGNDRSGRKTRMVAEVRPMRPSYSDVLAKSVSNQKPGKQNDGKTRPPEAKNGKNVKSSVGRSLSGNAHFNNRQNLSGVDDLSYTGSNSSLKATGMKKPMDIEADEPLPKKWVSLDDLTNGLSDNEFLAEAKIKKTSPKLASAKKVKDGWETIHLNNAKPTGGKVPGGKKGNINAGPKIQPITREKEPSVGLKFEPTKIKTAGEDRKGPSASQTKPLDAGKAARRNSRAPASKDKKGVRGRRRDVGAGWPALLANRADVIIAYVLRAVQWLVSLVLDVFALSTNLAFYSCTVFWCSSMSSMAEHYGRASDWLRGLSIVKRIATSRFWPFRRAERLPPPSDDDDDSDSEDGDGKKKKKRLPGGLKHNLPLPSTGEEAMKRLLACKGKDPYSILGVSQDCTDDDIKKYYKRQAFLVHPDKNNQPGAEEAFKILVHAFDIIGEPEHRKSYDRTAQKTAQAEQAWSELSDLLAQLHKKMEYVANTLRCTNCGKRHKRSAVNRPIYAARMCAQCKIHHSVREGDIWAETSLFGLMWRYFACMDGAVYDISEWAACQGSNLKNLKANTHQVQYRIVLGKQAQKNRSQQPTTTSGEPDLEEFINNLYSKPESAAGDGGGDASGRNRKQKRKK